MGVGTRVRVITGESIYGMTGRIVSEDFDDDDGCFEVRMDEGQSWRFNEGELEKI